MIIVYRDARLDEKCERSHPWTYSVWNPAHRYADFKANPELIEPTLEDLKPYAGTEFAQAFYDFFRDVNREGGEFETNDFAFGGIKRNDDNTRQFSHVADGRVMLLLRQLAKNLSIDVLNWLQNAFGVALADKPGENTFVGVSYSPAFYKAIDETGFQPGLNFWVFGNDVAEVSRGLKNLADVLQRGLREIESAMKPGYSPT